MRPSGEVKPGRARQKVDETQIPCTARQFREGHGGVEREENVGVPLGVRRGHLRELALGKLPICHLSSSGLGEAPTGSGREFCLKAPPALPREPGSSPPPAAPRRTLQPVLILTGSIKIYVPLPPEKSINNWQGAESGRRGCHYETSSRRLNLAVKPKAFIEEEGTVRIFKGAESGLPEKPKGNRKRWGQGCEPNRRPAPATDG